MIPFIFFSIKENEIINFAGRQTHSSLDYLKYVSKMHMEPTHILQLYEFTLLTFQHEIPYERLYVRQ